MENWNAGKLSDSRSQAGEQERKPNAFGPTRTQGISWKAVVFAVVLIPLNIYWIAVAEMVWTGLHFTAVSLPLNVIFILFWLIGYNAIARRISPQLAFSQTDLLVIYIILATSSAVAGYDSLVGLIGVLPHTTWFATPENDWGNLFARTSTDVVNHHQQGSRAGFLRWRGRFLRGELLAILVNAGDQLDISCVNYNRFAALYHRPPAPSLDGTGEIDLSDHTTAPFDE